MTLIDRRNFHLFQPLLYQAATGALSSDEIAVPLRGILNRQRNARVVMGEVREFDLEQQRIVLDALPNGDSRLVIEYDTLIVASGSRYSFFGHDEWRQFALNVKSLESALAVRRQIFTAFEAAEIEPDADQRDAWLTFVVVGGGPTGVEMAGQLAELARDAPPDAGRSADMGKARILLVEAADRVLTSFPPRLSAKAARALEQLGVTLLLNTSVIEINAESVTCRACDDETARIPARTIVWAAGVVASELAGALADAAGAERDRSGRVTVGPDLTIPGHPEVIALGDMASVRDATGKHIPLPGVAPVAMQQGRYAAKAVCARIRGESPLPFRYVDKGNLATIGRARAIADIKGIQLSGTLAWITWLGVHIAYLIGFQNRVLVLTRWTFSFLTHGRSARLITGASHSSEVGECTGLAPHSPAAAKPAGESDG